MLFSYMYNVSVSGSLAVSFQYGMVLDILVSVTREMATSITSAKIIQLAHYLAHKMSPNVLIHSEMDMYLQRA